MSNRVRLPKIQQRPLGHFVLITKRQLVSETIGAGFFFLGSGGMLAGAVELGEFTNNTRRLRWLLPKHATWVDHPFAFAIEFGLCSLVLVGCAMYLFFLALAIKRRWSGDAGGLTFPERYRKAPSEKYNRLFRRRSR